MTARRRVQRRQVVSKRRRRPAKPQLQATDLANAPLDLSRRTHLSPEHAAIHLDLPSVNALRMKVKRGEIPTWCYSRLGGALRFSRQALDELLQPPKREDVERAERAGR